MPLYSANNFLQSTSVAITTNTTTTSTTAVSLMSSSVTTSGGKLILQFVASCSNTSANTNVFFQLLVDGVVQDASVARYVATAATCAIQAIATGLSVGSHTVAANWFVSAGTGQIRPVAAPTAEFATLIVLEVLT